MNKEDLILHNWYYFDYPYLQKDLKFRFMGESKHGFTFVAEHPNYQEVTFQEKEFPLKSKKV